MIISALQLSIYAPCNHSLKEKRMEVKSLIAKTQHKFNVSVAEVDAQDCHQTIVLGFCCVACTKMLADHMLDAVLHFIEGNTQGEVTVLERELL